MTINSNFKNFVPSIQMQIFNSTDAIIILTKQRAINYHQITLQLVKIKFLHRLIMDFNLIKK